MVKLFFQAEKHFPKNPDGKRNRNRLFQPAPAIRLQVYEVKDLRWMA
jgi:hypothetical protein